MVGLKQKKIGESVESNQKTFLSKNPFQVFCLPGALFRHDHHLAGGNLFSQPLLLVRVENHIRRHQAVLDLCDFFHFVVEKVGGLDEAKFDQLRADIGIKHLSL